jgi:peptide/nickel transport system substrate-binding protein
MSHRRLITLAAVGAAGALLLSGCAVSGATDSDSTIRWALEGANLENGHMDPHQSQLDVSAMVGRLSLDSLTYLDSEGELRPWLATNWSVSEDGKIVTLDLRNDVTFSDGETFDAAAVKANFDHVVAAETASAQASDLLGGDSYLETVVIDDDTVEVVFSRPFTPFLVNASTAFLGMYSPLALADSAEQLATGGPGITVGSGPWLLTELVSGDHISYERNPNYAWAPVGLDADPEAATTLELKLMPDAKIRAESFRAAKVDLATELTPSAANELTADNFQVSAVPSPGVPYSLYLNIEHGVLGDVNVRRALSLGADIAPAVESVFSGQFPLAESVLSPSTPGVYATELEGSSTFDPERAGDLLDAAGWSEIGADGIRTRGNERLSLTWVSYTPFPEDRLSLAAYLIDGWREIGVEVDHQILEPGAYNEAYGTGSFDMTDWAFASTDGDILRNHLHTDGFQNASHVSDAALDGMLEAAAGAQDPAERARIYTEIQVQNADQVWILPIYAPGVLTAYAPGVDGLFFDGLGWPVLAGPAAPAA